MISLFAISFVVAGSLAWALHTALHRYALYVLSGRLRRSPGLRVPPPRIDPRTLDLPSRKAFYVELATTWTTIFLVLTLAGLLVLTRVG
jgi:hypothetical protein